jgi:ubiquinone/menaquinone biosynthesis C-methylase UbiE
MSRQAHKLGYHVVGYDINTFSLFIAKVLSLFLKNIRYDSKDFTTLTHKFDVVSATSLLSVVDDKKESLKALISLLKDKDSTLIIIEPTEHMSTVNVHALINDFKSWWHYKGLLLWSKAREGKSIPIDIYTNVENVKIDHKYYLSHMVRVTYIKKIYPSISSEI